MIYVAHDLTCQPQLYSIAWIEKIFQFRYINHLEFDNFKVEQWIKNKCLWAYKRGYIDPVRVWLGKLHRSSLEKQVPCNILLRWMNEEIGYGVFTMEEIKPWACIGHYAGLVRKRNLIRSNINDYCFMYPAEWISYKKYTIDSLNQGNFTRFINHSDKPNLESFSVLYEESLHMIFRATRKIVPGEELTCDYGDIYWKRRKKITL